MSNQFENLSPEQLSKILDALTKNKPVEIPEGVPAENVRVAILNHLTAQPKQVFVAHPSVGNILRKLVKKEVTE